jgi:hypothetical protein
MKQDQSVFSNGELTMDGPGDRADRRAVITRLDDSLAERFHRIPKFSVSVRSEAEVGADVSIL